METRPLAARVAIVHDVLPASHIRFAAVQVLTSAPLIEVESVFPEETMAISDRIRAVAPATCTNNSPSIARIGTMVPEKHPSMTTTLEHLKSHKPPPSTHMWPGLSIAPAMQAIVVNCVTIVDPQLAAIIGDDAKMVVASSEDPHPACPTSGEVITASEARPSAACVAIVHIMLPAGHVRPAIVQVLASATLTKVISILPKETMAISGFGGNVAPATCTYNCPTVPSVGAMVSEQHPSVATTLEHLKSHKMPTPTHMLSDLPIAPTM
jgi:hypothetical protein